MTAPSLSIFDWVLVALLFASTLRAFLRGFLLEALSLAGAVAGLLLASWNYPALATRLILWAKPLTTLAPTTAGILAFLAITGGIMVAGSLAGKLLRSSVDAIGLGFVDRCLGAVFGFVRGCLLGLAAMAVLTAFAPTARVIHNSRLFPYFLAGVRGVSFVVPQPLERQLAWGADRIKHTENLWSKPPQ